jgi:uncharacterized protein
MRILRWIVAVAAIALVVYTLYVGYEGSAQLGAVSASRGPQTYCYTPATEGWAYEAVNYDGEDDEHLRQSLIGPDGVLDEATDLADCGDLRGTAGDEILTEDGVRVAGWYIPAGNGSGPEAPTILLVHGNPANKSDMLRYARHLHDAFNLVLPDLRNSGRSSGDLSTTGVLEHNEISAVIDWLVETKGPAHIGALGDSGGAATILMAARTDDRIEAIVTDSSHASIEESIKANLGMASPPHPAYPGTWAILLGAWLRSGENPSAADPIDSVPLLGDRPYLILHGTDDVNNLPALSSELLFDAAADADVPVTLEYCEGATHGQVVDTCADRYGGWVSPFFESAFAD